MILVGEAVMVDNVRSAETGTDVQTGITGVAVQLKLASFVLVDVPSPILPLIR